MFAYTGLKPEQMDQLAKEVSAILRLFCEMLIIYSTLCMRQRMAEYRSLALPPVTSNVWLKPFTRSLAKRVCYFKFFIVVCILVRRLNLP